MILVYIHYVICTRTTQDFLIIVMIFAIHVYRLYHLRKILSVGKLKHFDNIGVNGEKRGV